MNFKIALTTAFEKPPKKSKINCSKIFKYREVFSMKLTYQD